MEKNNDIHLKTALDISRIRFTAGIRHLFDTPVHILTSVVLMAMLIGLLLYADGIFTSYGTDVAADISRFADSVKAPIIKMLTILLAYIYVMLRGTPHGAISLQLALRQAGIFNSTQEAPFLIGRTTSPENRFLTTLIWYSCGVPLSTFEDRRDAIEAAMNAYIVKISADRNTHHIIMQVIFGKDVQRELPPWRTDYIPQVLTQFALGVNLAGTPVIADLGKIPHILIGGSTGSGKSFLLKLVLFQAIYKDYQVFIADFKGGLDYLGPWEDHCRLCLDKAQVLDALSEIYEELNRRKQRFRENGCRDINEFNQQYRTDTVSHIIFACDEATAVFSRKQALKEEAEITKEIEAKAAYIAAQGRALGIHLILSLQRPDATVLDGQITNNIDYRICGRANQTLSKIVLDQTDAKTEVPKDGNGIFMMNDGTIFQTYRIDEATLWNE